MTGNRTTIFSTAQCLRGIIVISSFFLVILGMRNPMLSNSPAPKQRPRAVLENIAKASDVVVEGIVITAEATSFQIYEAPSFVCSLLATPPEEVATPVFAAPRLAARAPPVVTPV